MYQLRSRARTQVLVSQKRRRVANTGFAHLALPHVTQRVVHLDRGVHGCSACDCASAGQPHVQLHAVQWVVRSPQPKGTGHRARSRLTRKHHALSLLLAPCGTWENETELPES